MGGQMKQTILIIDDDKKLNCLLEKFLGDAGPASFPSSC